jgi:hypothetical protein
VRIIDTRKWILLALVKCAKSNRYYNILTYEFNQITRIQISMTAGIVPYNLNPGLDETGTRVALAVTVSQYCIFCAEYKYFILRGGL